MLGTDIIFNASTKIVDFSLTITTKKFQIFTATFNCYKISKFHRSSYLHINIFKNQHLKSSKI